MKLVLSLAVLALAAPAFAQNCPTGTCPQSGYLALADYNRQATQRIVHRRYVEHVQSSGCSGTVAAAFCVPVQTVQMVYTAPRTGCSGSTAQFYAPRSGCSGSYATFAYVPVQRASYVVQAPVAAPQAAQAATAPPPAKAVEPAPKAAPAPVQAAPATTTCVPLQYMLAGYEAMPQRPVGRFEQRVRDFEQSRKHRLMKILDALFPGRRNKSAGC